jgi:folylpolyglutamate synthase/dihydropteroate synthase
MRLAELRSHVEQVDPKRKIEYLETVSDAFVKAQESGKELIIVTGSLYLVGEMRELIFPTE